MESQPVEQQQPDPKELGIAQRVRGHMVRFVSEEGVVIWVNAFMVSSVEGAENRPQYQSTVSKSSHCRICIQGDSGVVAGTPDQAAALLMQARLSVSNPGETLAGAIGGLGLAFMSSQFRTDRKPSSPASVKPSAAPKRTKEPGRAKKPGGGR